MSTKRVLQPTDLHDAAAAFNAALSSLDEARCPVHPRMARRIVASYIMQAVLNGHTDPVALSTGAVSRLQALGSPCADGSGF
jgi:hypothetical protein